MGLAAWTGQSRGMMAAHRHLDLEINYVLSGTMGYLVGGRIVELPPGRICLLWGGVPHQMLRRQKAAEAIWVTIPLAVVLRWGLPERLIRPLLSAGILADASPRFEDIDLLRQWLRDLPRLDGWHEDAGGKDVLAGIVLLEIEARLRRFAFSLDRMPPASIDTSSSTPPGDGRLSAHRDRGLAAVEAMAQCISQSFHDPITISDIAEKAHLHPNYAMTLFRRHTGMTLSHYLVLQRVAHAQRLLAATDESIEKIAFDSGFGSVSRFYEAFRQQTGNSPRRFRLRLEQSRGQPSSRD